MKLILTTTQAKLLKALIEEKTLKLLDEDEKGYTDPRGTVWHTRNVDKIEKYDRIWSKIDKALDETE